MGAIFKTLAERSAAFEKASLYPVITPEFCAGRSVQEVVSAILRGGAKLFQLRLKHYPGDREFLKLAVEVRKMSADAGALMIVDDRVDIALACDADGVHLGQTDMPLADAKRIAPELLFGVSTHNLAEIEAVCKENPGYLNLGPIFATRTKEVGYPEVGIENLKRCIPHIKVPFSVMGGIKMHHLTELAKLGVKRPAMVTEITTAPDIAAKTAEMLQILQKSI